MCAMVMGDMPLGKDKTKQKAEAATLEGFIVAKKVEKDRAATPESYFVAEMAAGPAPNRVCRA